MHEPRNDPEYLPNECQNLSTTTTTYVFYLFSCFIFNENNNSYKQHRVYIYLNPIRSHGSRKTNCRNTLFFSERVSNICPYALQK